MSQTNIDAMRYCANTNLHRLKRQAINEIYDAIYAPNEIYDAIYAPNVVANTEIVVIQPKNYCDSDLDELFDNPKDKEWWRI